MNVIDILKLGAVAVAGWLYYKNSKSDDNTITFPEDDSTGSGSNDGTGINLDPDVHNPNAENPDISVTGFVRVGTLNYTSGYNGWSRGKIFVKLRNTSERASYIIKKMEVELYILGHRVGFKKDMIQDMNKTLNAGKELVVDFPNTACILTDCRDQLKKLICTEANKKYITSCSHVKINDIAEITVTIDWLPRNGAGEEMQNRWIGKPCDLEYVSEAWYTDAKVI